MEPDAPGSATRATVVDLLDRLLENGLVLRADLIISLAGIPLIGVSLHAAIAGMETMLEYGMMTDWEPSTRALEREHRAVAAVLPLPQGQEVLLAMQGLCHHSQGIYRAWRPGTIHLTNDRLVLYNQAFSQALVDLPLDTIASLGLTSVTNPDGNERPVLVVLAGSEEPVIRLRGQDMPALHRAVTERLAEMGRQVEQGAALAAARGPATSFLALGEEITHSGKMWFQADAESSSRPGALDWFLDDSTGPDATAWRQGTLYLTTRRLHWANDLDGQAGFDLPLERIASCAAETRSLSRMLKRQRILDLVYQTNGSKEVASFAGKEALDWQKAIGCVLGEGDRAGSAPESASQERLAVVASVAWKRAGQTRGERKDERRRCGCP
ncbi:gas vesicle protein [bacterium]|nr:gas vesicle protein [bacterium]